MSDTLQRIAVNYLQLTALAMRFPFQWPPAMQTLFHVHNGVSTAASSLLSLNCALGPNGSVAEVQYTKLLLVAGTIPVALGAVALFWRSKRRSITQPYTWADRSILTSGLALTLVYPTLCGQALVICSCRWVGNGLWLRQDLQEACFQGRHLAWFLALALPCLLVCMGLPLGLLIIIRRGQVRDKLNDLHFRAR